MAERSKKLDQEIIELMPLLKRNALYYTKDKSAADDLVQETLIKAFTYIGHFKEGTNLRGWLTTILKNRFIAKLRTSNREIGLEEFDSFADVNLTQSANQEYAVDVKHYERVMRFIPKQSREAFYAVVVMKEEYSEVAERLNLPIGTIKSVVSRARVALEALANRINNTKTTEVRVNPFDKDTSLDKSIRKQYITDGKSISELQQMHPDKPREELMKIVVKAHKQKPIAEPEYED